MNKMKKFLMILIASIASVAFLIGTALPVSAAAPWSVTGNYEATFLLDGDVSNTPYTHHVALTQNGTGVTGSGGYPASGSDTYHWNVTSGTQTGDSLNLTVSYDLGAPGTVMNMTGTINPNGTVAGTWTDNFGGSRSGTWSVTKGVSVPMIQTPANNATVTTAAMVKVDWTDSDGANAPFQYQYEAYSDAAYTSRIYQSGWLSSSEIPTPGTPPGTYYVRVKAKDTGSVESAWSNGAGNAYKITVTANPTPTPVLVGPPTTVAECKNNGWQTFNNPSFASQAACTAYVIQHGHSITGVVSYSAYGLARTAQFSMNTAYNTGSFLYQDANHGWYIVTISKVKVNGKVGYFAGKVILASNPAWTSQWLFAKVSDNTPSVDMIWGSFTTQIAAESGVSAMSNPADGSFNTSGVLLVN